MRTQWLTCILLAATVAGCAGNPPPPPPPMAEAPPPAPPAAVGPVDGTYKGAADLDSDSPSRCRKMTAMQTVRVRNQAFAIAGMRAKIGQDGAITANARRNNSLSGNADGSKIEVKLTQGQCTYHYDLVKS